MEHKAILDKPVNFKIKEALQRKFDYLSALWQWSGHPEE